MAIQTCYAAFASLGSDAAAKWFSWLMLPAQTLLVAEEVYLRSSSRRLALVAGAIILTCPLLATFAATLYSDLPTTLLCTAGFVVLFRALHGRCLRGILLSAFLMGSMAQVKYTGLIFCVVWGLMLSTGLLWRCGWRVALRWSVAGGLCLLVVAVPWFVYVYEGTGNPFYPFLHKWFPSPYWVDGMTIQTSLEKNFRLDPGILGLAKFPWIATYHTNRVLESYNGFLGYWFVALIPCWFLGRLRRAPPYWDMTIAGAAMLGGILAYTPYARYWMPACPLLIASGTLAAGGVFRSQAWAANDRVRQCVFGVALTGLLLLPAPMWCLNPLWWTNLSWDEYAKRISTEECLARRFPEYPAVEQLNRILKPGEGVICSESEGVCLVQGPSYEFSFMWNGIHRIHDVESFADFCRRYGIRYWLVGHSRPSPGGELVEKYWIDSRIVAASGTVTVYDLSPSAPRPQPPFACHPWPPLLEAGQKPWSPGRTPPRNWVNLLPDAAANASDGTIFLSGAGRIGHHLPADCQGGMCKIEVDLQSARASSPLLELTWYDEHGTVLGYVCGGGPGGHDNVGFHAALYSPVPPGAKDCWVGLWEWKGLPMRLRGGGATFWSVPGASGLARREQASGWKR